MASAAAAATVVFVDVRFYEDKRRINDIRYRAKVASSTAHQLNYVVKKAAGSLVKHIIEGGGGRMMLLGMMQFTNLTDLPSHKWGDGKQSKKDKEERDTKMAKKLGRNIWQSKAVSFLTCFHCAKRRCIYSPTQAGYVLKAGTLKQKLELVSGRYSCGDLLFDDSDPLSKVLVQKQNLTSESHIENEKGYYNNAERSLELQDICIHCGDGGEWLDWDFPPWAGAVGRALLDGWI